MSERENDNPDSAVDPPVDQPGGEGAMRTEAPSEPEAAVDPPVNQPGGGGTEE